MSLLRPGVIKQHKPNQTFIVYLAMDTDEKEKPADKEETASTEKKEKSPEKSSPSPQKEISIKTEDEIKKEPSEQETKDTPMVNGDDTTPDNVVSCPQIR